CVRANTVVGRWLTPVVGRRSSAVGKTEPGRHGFSRADINCLFVIPSEVGRIRLRTLPQVEEPAFPAGESGDDGIRDALPLSYTAEAMAGVEPATFGLEVTVVFTTGELQIPRS